MSYNAGGRCIVTPRPVELSKNPSIPGWPCIRPAAFSPPWTGPPNRTGTTPAPAADLNSEPTCVFYFIAFCAEYLVKASPPGNELRILALMYSLDTVNWLQAGYIAMSRNPLEAYS